MTGRPLVTVAIPTFNRAAALERCLTSIREQTYEPIEVIVCDNASSDDTPEVVARALTSIPRGRYVRHESNMGAHQNFRTGLDLATGDYFMWLADDDWLHPDYVTRCVEVLEADPQAVLANGDAIYYREGKPIAEEAGVDLPQSSAARRILAYFAQVWLNAEFYGVGPTAARRAASFSSEIAGDWLHVADLAARGTVLRVPTSIHRATTGASSEIGSSLAGFTRPIAKSVAVHIRRAPTLSNERAVTRIPLAAACAGLIYWRFGLIAILNQSVARLIEHLRPRLSAGQFHQLRSMYRRLVRRHASRLQGVDLAEDQEGRSGKGAGLGSAR